MTSTESNLLQNIISNKEERLILLRQFNDKHECVILFFPPLSNLLNLIQY